MAGCVVGLGEALLRLSPPPGIRLDDADRLQVHAAGSELNVVVALARLGVGTRWVSALPSGPLGDRVLRELRVAGVDERFVQRRDGRLGLFFAEAPTPPRTSRVIYDRAESAFTTIDELPAEAFDEADWAVVSGITPALGPKPLKIAQRFVAAASQRDVRICIDVNHRSRLWTEDEARAALTPLLALASVVVCSERDARAIFSADSPQTLAKVAPAAEVIVVTRSGDGASYMSREGVAGDVSAIRATVIDRFGAGDAFTAGLLYGLIHRQDPATAVRHGTALAALKLSTAGDLSHVSAEELKGVVAGDRTGLER